MNKINLLGPVVQSWISTNSGLIEQLAPDEEQI